MCLEIGKALRGPGLWKFNDSLLNDDDYIETVNACIERTLAEYGLPIYTREYLSNENNYEDIQMQINIDLFYETLLVMIRKETIKYSKLKARQRRAKEIELLGQIEAPYAQYTNTNKDEDAQKLNDYKEKLEDLRHLS